LDLLSLGSRAALGVSFLLSVARAWLRRTPRGLSCLPIRGSSRCPAPSSSEGEVTSTTGKALFHLRFRKLPMAPGMRCRTSFPTLAIFPPKRQMTEEKIIMKAIVVTDQAGGRAGMTLVERPEPQAATTDVVVQVHASGFT